MFAEVVVFYLLPYVYMSLHMADKAALSREVAARWVLWLDHEPSNHHISLS